IWISLLGKLMINDNEIDITAIVTTSGVKLQTEVSEITKSYLRIEAIRRKMTMGQLIDWIVESFSSIDLPKSTS
ncbi:hypothetical protein, partial [Microcoleus sp. K4-C2]|uniref:hypothetical protein n=1 Tax=Microcoleus sp. K4-C2 TaxID=2818792 RepID=UPI002FD5BE15